MDAIPLSITKIKEINELHPNTTIKEKMPYFMPLYQYHTRWKEIYRGDIDVDGFNRDHRMMNWLETYLTEKEITFLNYYKREITFDYENDFMDNSHLNFNGSTKLMEDLGTYLGGLPELHGRKSEEAYQSWNKDYKKYEKYIREKRENLEKNDEDEDDNV